MSLSAADGTMAVPGIKTERAALSTEPQTWYPWRFCSEDLASPRLFKSRRPEVDDLLVKMLLHLFRKSRAEVLARPAERKSRKGSTRRRGRGFRRASRFTSPLDLKPRIEAPRKSCRSPSGII